MTGDRTFNGGCFFDGFPAGSYPLVSGGTSFDLTTPIQFTAASNIYSVQTFGGTMQTFSSADLVASPPANTIAYSKTSALYSNPDLFSIITPDVGGALIYTRHTSTTIGPSAQDCVIGVPTLATDFPAAAVDYTQNSISGKAYDRSSGTVVTYDLAKSTVAFRYEPSPLTMRATVHLIGTPATGPDVDFGTYALTAQPAASEKGFLLRYDQAAGNNRYVLDAGGALFGPQASEYGFAVSFNRRVLATETREVEVDAIVVGRR